MIILSTHTYIIIFGHKQKYIWNGATASNLAVASWQPDWAKLPIMTGAEFETTV